MVLSIGGDSTVVIFMCTVFKTLCRNTELMHRISSVFLVEEHLYDASLSLFSSLKSINLSLQSCCHGDRIMDTFAQSAERRSHAPTVSRVPLSFEHIEKILFPISYFWYRKVQSLYHMWGKSLWGLMYTGNMQCLRTQASPASKQLQTALPTFIIYASLEGFVRSRVTRQTLKWKSQCAFHKFSLY